jgi:hypothetical protein
MIPAHAQGIEARKKLVSKSGSLGRERVREHVTMHTPSPIKAHFRWGKLAASQKLGNHCSWQTGGRQNNG